MPPSVLVTGATGKVGRATVDALLARGADVRAASRHLDTAAGVKRVTFDWARPDTYDAALAGVDRVFVLLPSGVEDVGAPGRAFLDRARAAGVERVVLMTAMGVEHAPPEVPLRALELHVEGLGVPATVLRPNWFAQNFSEGVFREPIVRNGVIRLPAGDAAVSFVDVRDIGAVAAAALVEDGHEGAAYTVTGPAALTHADAAEAIGRAAGRPVRYEPVDDDAFRAAMGGMGWDRGYLEALVGLFGMSRAGAAAPVSPDVERVLGRPATPFAQFAADHADAWR